MSLIPNVSGSTVAFVCDKGHPNSVAASDSASNAPSGPSAFSAVLTCSTCHESSTHPISGGADQPRVQALFLAVAEAKGCPCGALAAGKSVPLVRSHLRAHAQQLGAGFVA